MAALPRGLKRMMNFESQEVMAVMSPSRYQAGTVGTECPVGRVWIERVVQNGLGYPQGSVAW